MSWLTLSNSCSVFSNAYWLAKVRQSIFLGVFWTVGSCFWFIISELLNNILMPFSIVNMQDIAYVCNSNCHDVTGGLFQLKVICSRLKLVQFRYVLLFWDVRENLYLIELEYLLEEFAILLYSLRNTFIFLRFRFGVRKDHCLWSGGDIRWKD